MLTGAFAVGAICGILVYRWGVVWGIRITDAKKADEEILKEYGEAIDQETTQ